VNLRAAARGVNLRAAPARGPLLDAVARAWLDRGGDPADGFLLLPGRRAARALAEAFLRVSEGRPLLLPRILGVGALDEAPLSLEGTLELKPPVEQAERLAVLSRMILALRGRFGAPQTADRAWPLAGELTGLMDEAEQAGIDLAAKLPDAAEAAHAVHWRQTLTFLEIVTQVWPDWLAERGLANPASRLNALFDAQCAAWEAAPPDYPVWAVGFTGGIPSLFRLLCCVAGLPQGLVVVPALDRSLSEAEWEGLKAFHPQDGLRRLLNGIGARRDGVEPWDAEKPSERFQLLSRALLPAEKLAVWREAPPPSPDGLSRLDAADEQEEAVAVALVLREAVQKPGTRAALVTPDRALAARVAAELKRFGVLADDSAGSPLAARPAAAFLRLVALAWTEGLAPVALLSVLKHPLCAMGLESRICRERARQMELALLRGPRLGPGIAALRAALGVASEALQDLGERLEAALMPLAELGRSALPDRLLGALLQAGEALAATDKKTGADALWGGADGAALATHLSAVLAALPVLPEQETELLPGLLDAVLEGAVVRDAQTEALHPRIFIWGLLEARLQTVDVVVLGGLAEGIWPPAVDPGPWLSRPMRAGIGLPPPEEHVGAAALDFVTVACSAPVAVLSCPRRRDGAPAVPARWLARLSALLDGHGMALPVHPAAAWAQQLDQPEEPKPRKPPRPCPKPERRPRRLSVTEIETWIRDPYAIHARHILQLKRLDDLDQVADPAEYGEVVHLGLNKFLRQVGADWPADAEARLMASFDAALAESNLRPALVAWWRPRLRRIAGWVCRHEAGRRGVPLAGLDAECVGKLVLEAEGGAFTLTGRADRIEQDGEGNLTIIDYKTGQPPSQKQVEAMLSPQLPLEATMAERGAFPLAGPVTGLAYWHLGGGFEPGKEARVGEKIGASELAEAAWQKLNALIEAYDEPGRAYLSQPVPGRAPRFSDYAQLARVAEWLLEGEEDEG
jgi:ATP-dependent helicase/nuclease subunit B